MKRNGNTNINRTFNPQNTKPPIPLDVDEVDAVLERFIRQKYDQQLFSSGRAPPAARNHTGSTRSSEDQPPPLPPKPAKRFGFGLRSTSSAVNMQRSLPASPPLSPNGTHGFNEPIRVNKQSRVFGASVGGGSSELDSKLAQLRDMGFTDDKRNANVLKGLGGNLERTIESLVRLGEGSAPVSRSRTPNPPRNIAVSQPVPAINQSTGVVNGLSFASNGTTSPTSGESQSQPNNQNKNPTQIQPQGNTVSPNPYQQQTQTYNPFYNSNQQTTNVPLENAFAGMQISQQPLFPNATGGYPSQHQQQQEARFQTMTPPVPQVPQQYTQSNPYVQQNTTPNNYNPFFQNQQVSPVSANPYASNIQTQDTQYQQSMYQQTQNPQPLYNGYTTSSPQNQSPQVQQGSFPPQPFQQQHAVPQQQSFSQQQPFQQQQSQPPPQPQLQQQQFTNPYQNQQPQQQQSSNPYATQQPFANAVQYPMQQPQPPQPPQQYNQFTPQPLQAQLTGRVDKSSILALYNYPQLAPPPLPSDSGPAAPNGAPPPSQATSSPQRSVTMPLQLSSGSRNPFQPTTTNVATAQGNMPGPYKHASQESVDVGGYQNGRHSPDAFASLSARFVR